MSVEVKAQNTLSMTSVKAIKDATDEANSLLDSMRQSAIDAGTTLNGIYQDAMDAQTSADNAQASADSASEYASRAYANLSTVQNITETLNWITAHGTMTLTTDTQLDPTHIYFVADQNGDYVVGGQHYAVVPEPDIADISTYYELSINESLNNYVATHLAVDSEGLWIIPDAGGNKVLIATGSGSTYTTAGTYIIGKVNNVDRVLAKFTSSGADIGQYAGGNSITRVNTTGLQVIGISGTLGETPIVDLDTGQNNRSFSIGTRNTNLLRGTASFVAGELNGASGDHSVAIGYGSTASDDNAVAIGYQCTASDEGAVAIGKSVTASGQRAYAEGDRTTASGDGSHAEGNQTTASGYYSHAGGDHTIAQRRAQSVIGRFNEADTTGANTSADGKYIFIIGNGTSANARSNAFEVDWSGNVNIPSGAKYQINGTALSASDVGAIASSDIVTSVSASSTDDKVPSAKCVYERTTPTVIQAHGSGDISTTSGAITQIPLVATGAVYNNTRDAEIDTTLGGIKIKTAGIYKVWGSVYFTFNSSASASGVYIRRSTNGGNYASATEVNGILASGTSIPTAPKPISCAVNDVIYLAGRIVGASGKLSGTNSSTFLCVEKI